MKKMFLLTFLAVVFMLRIATGVRITEIFQKEVYRMSFNLVDSKVKDLKINNKYPLKNIKIFILLSLKILNLKR